MSTRWRAVVVLLGFLAMAAAGAVRDDLERKIRASDAASEDRFGLALSLDGDTAVVGARLDDLSGLTNAGSAYVYQRAETGSNNWLQVVKLVASDAGQEDQFGAAVAVAGDVAVVGSPQADTAAADAGAAYVFLRTHGGTTAWGQAAKLRASDGVLADFFGSAVAADGDVIVVGALGGNSPGFNNAGAAYVFIRRPGVSNAWDQVAKLTAADKAADDEFGVAVAVAGDVVVVGAHRADPAGTNSAGAAYVFERNAGGTNAWGQVAKLTASDLAANDLFGSAVSAWGDVVLIGADSDDSWRGAAYVFQRNRGGTNAWGEAARLEASDRAANDYFGSALSVRGDLALVGAFQEDPSSVAEAGSAYLFARNAGGPDAWGEVGKLTASDATASDNFGAAVALSGDVALIGSYRADPGGVTNAGAAYAVPLEIEAWTHVTMFMPTDRVDAAVGAAVAAAGDVVAVGAPDDDDLGALSGSCFVLERRPGATSSWVRVSKITAFDGAAGDGFGSSVDVDGDILVSGSPYDDDLGTSSGSAYVYERDAGGTNVWGRVRKLLPSDGASTDNFGCDVAADGDVIVVGSEADAAYLFVRNPIGTNNWSQVKKLVPAVVHTNKAFGRFVAVAGDVVAVTEFGIVHIFERNAGGTNAWGVVRAVEYPYGGESRFARGVAAAPDAVVVGSPGLDDIANFNFERAYVFVIERGTGGTNGWAHVVALPYSEAAFSYFGEQVAIDGASIVAGGRREIGADAAVQLFQRSAEQTSGWRHVGALLDPTGEFGASFGYEAVDVAGQVVVVGAPNARTDVTNTVGAAHLFEGDLHGLPVITKVSEKLGDILLSFAAQPAWRYDIEWTTNAPAQAWFPEPGETNMVGSTSGGMSRGVPMTVPSRLLRVRRYAPQTGP